VTVREYTALVRAIEDAGDCCPDCVKEHMRSTVERLYKIAKENETR
jgi:hypothetical protein